jgi:hypothetical protein
MSPPEPGAGDARIRAEVAEFLSSDHGEPFASDRAGAGLIAREFLDVCAREIGERVDLLDEEHLREALLSRLPRRLAPGDPLAQRAPAVIRALLAFAHERRPNANSWKLDAVFDELEPRFGAALRALGGSGVAPASAPITRPGSKLGRNDPCPCGSGKKWKKCCGAGAAG